ncbi:YhgE/Pip domain-containing protein [Clostridium arbusti]|uniref:YhgE/Pip domain-containing protein n=1 Tax=Clostridium arbusti TaxID=1137848 RepID=UPI00028916B6|nr:YhgE/Pip domain-containing protein [Clostridium arbusti]
MKKLFGIFIRDIKNIAVNPAAIVIVLGLCILPSLYAWINIKACWNPYANTGNLPIAIINEDEGAVLNGKNINVGDQVVDKLKNNKTIDWIFVDQWQGNYGLNEGKYYALIEIPNNFSEGLVSLASTNPKKPNIIYKSNEKLNAIAAKITNAVKEKFANDLKSEFVGAVNREAINTLNSIVDNPDKQKAQIIQFKETLDEANNNIADIKKYIGEANSNSLGLQNYLGNVQNNLPKVTEQINSLQQATESSKTLVSDTSQTISSTASTLNNDMVQAQSINNRIQTLLQQIKDTNNSAASLTNSKDITNNISNLSNLNDSLDKTIGTDIRFLQSIAERSNNNNLSNMINSLNSLDGLIKTEGNNLNQLKTMIGNKADGNSLNDKIDKISEENNEISNNITSNSNDFYVNVLPVLNNMRDNLNTNLDDVNSVLESTKVIVPQLNALAKYGIATSKLSVNQANQLNDKLSAIQNQLNELTSKMKAINGDNLNDIVKILQMNPNKLSSFISSPLDVKEVDVYGEGIFGVGLTPFYTVLAIWVGALLLCALLTTECKNFEGKGKLNFVQKHFGKMLLFLLIALIQAAVVTLGDKYILGVNPKNMVLMMEFALVSSVTFTIIIFTLVSLMGNVGKAIAVVMMVFQIAGAGGIYPIQTNPKIFGVLEPLWPFTYAINGFREAIAGPIWSNVQKNFIALGYFIIIFLLLAILKPVFHKVTEFMEHKFKQSGL